jgi:hypothetical protein
MRTLLRDRTGAAGSPSSSGAISTAGAGNSNQRTTPASDALKRYQFNNAKIKTQEMNNSVQYSSVIDHDKENRYNTLNSQHHVTTPSPTTTAADRFKSPSPPDIALVDALETSMLHYHNTYSVTSPLSPLGAGGGGGGGGEQYGLKNNIMSPQSSVAGVSATVSLAGLSMYRDKMSSWRDKYN